MNPELNSPLFSPSAETICSSPEERDALQTPLNSGAERHIFSAHYTLASHSTPHHDFIDREPLNADEYPMPTRLSPLPELFGVYPLEQKAFGRTSCQPPFHSQTRDVTNTALEIDPFAASFHVSAQDIEYSSRTQVPAPQSPHLPSLLLQTSNETPHFKPSLTHSSLSKYYSLNRNASIYSHRFPVDHQLDKRFVQEYQLGDELGSGGYGFVLTAHHRAEGREVAVKFIIKDKVPEDAWMETEGFKRPLPAEIIILNYIEHENIVKCLDLYEDSLYFYMVQELHGSPWKKYRSQKLAMTHMSNALSIPMLTPSASDDSLPDCEPETPPQLSLQLHSHPDNGHSQSTWNDCYSHHDEGSPTNVLLRKPVLNRQRFLQSTARPEFSRRPSHDLFECIEQSKHKRLPERQARYVFAQVAEAVHYLDSLGITHRDIKDENLVIDKDLKVKLIDFGSAILADPSKPRPFYALFFGTTAYAASEVLRKQPYQAQPAEIWTLGILMSYLLTGMSPFPTERDAVEGNIIINDLAGMRLSQASLDLMRRCLEPDPNLRADIQEVRSHQWLAGALDGF